MLKKGMTCWLLVFGPKQQDYDLFGPTQHLWCIDLSTPWKNGVSSSIRSYHTPKELFNFLKIISKIRMTFVSRHF